MSSKPSSLLPLLLLLALWGAGCTPGRDETDGADAAAPSLVVEGWIEDGEFPIVKLTRPVPITTHYQPVDSLEAYVARWRRVTITRDDGLVATLTGKYDRRYFPPYIYTTTAMHGEAGRCYRLTVFEDDGSTLTALTTIPQGRVQADSFRVESVGDSLLQLFACVSMPAGPSPCHYKVSALTSPQKMDFLSSFMGVGRSDMADDASPCRRIAIHRGRTNLQKDYTPYFRSDDSLVVRISCIDAAAYDYWRSFEDMLSLSRIPMFPAVSNMPSQIPGAYGYWQGMNSTFSVVRISELLPRDE